MSFFKWLSGGTFASHVETGNELFAQKQYGDAKLAFLRAIKKSKDESLEQKRAIQDKIGECSFELALGHIARAKDFFELGDGERALGHLDDALLICDTAEMEKRVAECREEFVHLETKAMAEEHEEMTEEELLAVISSAWTTRQAQEFSNYPELFYQGVIKGHDGEHGEAVQCLQEVIAQQSDDNAVFIYLELGRQQLLAEEVAAAQASLETFVEKCTVPSEAKDELVLAYNLLANIYFKEEQFESAEKALMTAYRVSPDNHVPLLNLGIFLRERGELKRSKRSLENAMDTMGVMHPDMRVFRELGHTSLAMGNRDDAREYYKAVLDHCCQRGVHEQYDPEAALPLAAMYEEDGKIREASDIYRHLAQGYDTKNYFEYNIQSARLLSILKAEVDLVRQYLACAEEFVKTPEQEARILELQSSLE